jgi:hypothetical protein
MPDGALMSVPVAMGSRRSAALFSLCRWPEAEGRLQLYITPKVHRDITLRLPLYMSSE